MRLHCNQCGKSVSTEVPDDTLLRAWAECPECIAKDTTKHDLLAACEAVLKVKGGHTIMGEALCPICSYPGKHKRGCPYPLVEKAIAKARGEA